jgi:hypothetical protein
MEKTKSSAQWIINIYKDLKNRDLEIIAITEIGGQFNSTKR